MADLEFEEFENPTFDEYGADDDRDTLQMMPMEAGTNSKDAPSLRQELLKDAVDRFYDGVSKREGLNPLARDYSKFEVASSGQLRLKAYPGIKIVAIRNGEPLSLKTIYSSKGGGKAIREDLGFPDWSSKKPSLPATAVAALQKADEELGAAAAEAIGLTDLGGANKASAAIQEMETTLTNENIDGVLETMNDPPLDMRELRGLDKALQTIRGEHINNLAKLSQLDKDIAKEEQKLSEADNGQVDEFARRRIAERLREYQEEREVRLEAASASMAALRSQINRIRETISRILHEDTTLAERVRTLFREQGITVASILTAIGMAISTLVLALTGGGSGSPTPTPPAPDKDGFKEWVKKHLQSLGRVLAKLASKAAAALPGIIGSIVSWLFKTAGKAANWLAEHVWAAMLSVGALLLFAAKEWLMK